MGDHLNFYPSELLDDNRPIIREHLKREAERIETHLREVRSKIQEIDRRANRSSSITTLSSSSDINSLSDFSNDHSSFGLGENTPLTTLSPDLEDQDHPMMAFVVDSGTTRERTVTHKSYLQTQTQTTPMEAMMGTFDLNHGISRRKRKPADKQSKEDMAILRSKGGACDRHKGKKKKCTCYLPTKRRNDRTPQKKGHHRSTKEDRRVPFPSENSFQMLDFAPPVPQVGYRVEHQRKRPEVETGFARVPIPYSPEAQFLHWQSWQTHNDPLSLANSPMLSMPEYGIYGRPDPSSCVSDTNPMTYSDVSSMPLTSAVDFDSLQSLHSLHPPSSRWSG